MRNTTVDELYDSLKELHNEKNHDYAADDRALILIPRMLASIILMLIRDKLFKGSSFRNLSNYLVPTFKRNNTLAFEIPRRLFYRSLTAYMTLSY